MTTSNHTANPDLAPLTVAHGRKLFDQSKAIADLLDQLIPLLQPADMQSTDAESDPIHEIINLLTSIASAQELQAQRQEFIDQKLDFLIAHFTDNAP